MTDSVRPEGESAGSPSAPPFLAVGEVVGTWGIRGELKVRVLTEVPERFDPDARVYVDGQPFTVEHSRPYRAAGFLVVKLRELNDSDTAAGFRGRLLEIPTAEAKDLPPGQYYYYQILGLDVRTTDGRRLGTVVDILSTGSNDVYIVRDGGREHLIPAIPDVVKAIDPGAGRMLIEPIPGLLE